MDDPNERWCFELWPLWPWKVGRIKNLHIMLSNLTRCMSDKNLAMIWPMVKELYQFFCFQLTPPGANPRIGLRPKSIGLVSHPAPTYPQNNESFGTAVFHEMYRMWMALQWTDLISIFQLVEVAMPQTAGWTGHAINQLGRTWSLIQCNDLPAPANNLRGI
jgi:hypothetical protein